MAADPPTSSISSSNGAEALSTAHLYYEDTELFSNTAIIAAIQPGNEGQEEEGTATLVLDQTVMHPQGGAWFMKQGYESKRTHSHSHALYQCDSVHKSRHHA